MDPDLLNIQYKDIINEATDIVHIVSPEGIIYFANESWKRALQYSLDEVTGKSIYSFIHPDKVEQFKALREEVIANQKIHCAIDTILVTKGRELVFVEGFMSCHIVNHQVVYTHSILRDVTTKVAELQVKEETLIQIQEREQNFHQLIEYAPDAIIVINEDSRIRLWNPKSEQLFGWTYEEVRGTLLGDTIIPEQYRKRHYEGMKRFLESGEARVLNKTIDITALNKAGEEFFIALTISKAVHKGQPIFIAFIRDISDQKKMAREIEDRRKELEITNEELAQYASLASHDLKEPVRKILTFCDMLINPRGLSKPNQQIEYLSKIYNSAKRMADLIDSVNKLSNIASIPLEEEPVSFNEVIKELLVDLEEDIILKGASFQIDHFPQMFMNRLHVYQLFNNLISNALKYSKPNICPLIVIKQLPQKDGMMLFQFSDNGLGFPNEFAEKMFHPFQRLHGKNYPGTGIGLSICKKIIEAYNGSIHSIGKPDLGATFTFELPVTLLVRR